LISLIYDLIAALDDPIATVVKAVGTTAVVNTVALINWRVAGRFSIALLSATRAQVIPRGAGPGNIPLHFFLAALKLLATQG
jgi:hypothetical protein